MACVQLPLSPSTNPGIIEHAKSEGLKQLCGEILQENTVMLKMCRELGFKVVTDAQDRGVCDVALTL